MWEHIDHSCNPGYAKWYADGRPEVPRESQSNFDALARGNFGIVCLSMVPIERQMFHPRFLNMKKKGILTLACATGIDVGEFDEIFSKEDISYFPILRENIEFLTQEMAFEWDIEGNKHTYELVKSREHLLELEKDPTKLAVVLTIEGSHVLGRSLRKKDVSDEPEFRQLVMENASRLKGMKPLSNWKEDYLEYPIFFLGINHFFWNGIAGQARVFDSKQALVMGRSKGVDEGVTEVGKEVIPFLLSKEEGRRILLDSKHMSWETREWYYELLDSMKAKGDTVPLIYSHVALAGLESSEKEFSKKDSKGKNKDSYFNRWSINIADDEVRKVHESKGLLGLMMDKYRLCGDLAEEAMAATEHGSDERKAVYMQVIMLNIFQAVHAVQEKSAWDIISIGSDFDGLINAFEFYDTSDKFPQMAADMQAFLESPTAIFDVFTVEDIQQLMFDYSPADLVKKVMSSNARDFIVRNFPD